MLCSDALLSDQDAHGIGRSVFLKGEQNVGAAPS
jgi:hypothetical protein